MGNSGIGSLHVPSIWRFPEIEVPPNDPLLAGIFHDVPQNKPSSYGDTPIDGHLHIRGGI